METENKITDFVKNTLSGYSGVPSDDIKDETEISEFRIDSLNYIEVIMALEDEFDIEISDETSDGFKLVSDIIDFIKETA